LSKPAGFLHKHINLITKVLPYTQGVRPHT